MVVIPLFFFTNQKHLPHTILKKNTETVIDASKDNEVEEDEMGRSCSTNGGEEEGI
jgi:hypothetical protein